MNVLKELLKLYLAFFRIGAFTFGGGYAMLPMLEKEIVEKYKWATIEEIMDYFAIGQCTPGIIAVNTATFIGYKRKGIAGGIVATLGVITPSVIIISVIATLLTAISGHPVMQHAFNGIGVAVCAILIQAVLKVSKSALIDRFTWIIGIAAFFLSLIFDLSAIIIVIAAGILGISYKSVLRKRSKED